MYNCHCMVLGIITDTVITYRTMPRFPIEERGVS